MRPSRGAQHGSVRHCDEPEDQADPHGYRKWHSRPTRGGVAVTLTEVDPETAEPTRGTVMSYRRKKTGKLDVSPPHAEYVAERNDDDTPWVVDCSTGKGCGARYEVTDDELRRAVELGRDRKVSGVIVPDEVVRPLG